MNNVMTVLTVFITIFIFATTACDNSGDRTIVSAWVQAGANGTSIARVITKSDNCPEIKINDVKFEMELRQEPSINFPVRVCELTIPPGTQSVSVDSRKLEIFKVNPTRIVVVGDTGCRIEDGDPAQACNDPNAWPFKKASDLASSFKPDVVIHVGDYVYRESECPAGDAGCEGSPFGDNFDTWNADFFSPADSLLRTAPWVFTRGNHELCNREGAGWFTFLDPNPPFPECQEFTPPYTVDLGFLKLLMLDSSSADDDSAPPNFIEVLTAQIDILEALSGDNAWLVSHIPVWAIGFGNGELFMIDDSLQSASGNDLEGGINLVLSGHLHSFEVLIFESSRQSQFIVGNSGTQLDTAVTDLVGMQIAGDIVGDGSINIAQFGYATMELVEDVWNVSIRNTDGEELYACKIDVDFTTCLP